MIWEEATSTSTYDIASHKLYIQTGSKTEIFNDICTECYATGKGVGIVIRIVVVISSRCWRSCCCCCSCI